jgi:hypothetical protein
VNNDGKISERELLSVLRCSVALGPNLNRSVTDFEPFRDPILAQSFGHTLASLANATITYHY